MAERGRIRRHHEARGAGSGQQSDLGKDTGRGRRVRFTRDLSRTPQTEQVLPAGFVHEETDLDVRDRPR